MGTKKHLIIVTLALPMSLALVLALASSCTKKVSNDFNAVTFECGQMDLPKGFGAIKLTSATDLSLENKAIDTFKVNGEPLNAEISAKNCLAAPVGDHQLVSVGSNRLNVYFYDTVTVKEQSVTPAALRDLESAEIGMTCGEEIWSRGVVPFNPLEALEIPNGFTPTFGLTSIADNKVQWAFSHKISDSKELMLLYSDDTIIPDGKYGLTAFVKHAVLSREFDIKNVSQCRITVDRQPPSISIDALGRTAATPAIHVSPVSLDTELQINVADNLDDAVATTLSLFEIVGSERVFLSKTAGTRLKLAKAGVFFLEVESVDHAGNSSAFGATLAVDAEKPVIIFPERRSYKPGEAIDILTTGADTVLFCVSEVNGPSCTDAKRDLTDHAVGPDGATLTTIYKDVEGVYIITVSAKDASGNSTGLLDFVVSIDGTAPSLKFTDPDRLNSGLQAVKLNRRDLSFGYSTNDPTALMSCQVEWIYSSQVDCEVNAGRITVLSPLPNMDLTYKVRVQATDEAGNYSYKQMTLVYSSELTFFDICGNPENISITNETVVFLAQLVGSFDCAEIRDRLLQMDSLSSAGFANYMDLGVLSEFVNIRHWQLDNTPLLDSAPFARLKPISISAENSRLSGITGVGFGGELKKLMIGGNAILDPFALTELRGLESLDLSRSGVMLSLYKEIVLPESLTELSINATDENDLSKLSHLRNLRTLNANLNYVKDLTPLAGMSELVNLDLRGNNGLEVVQPISALQKLSTLDLSFCRVRDLETLSNLNVTYLDVRNNDLRRIRAIPAKLSSLMLADNGLADLDFLQEGMAIEVFDISGNDIEELSGLKYLASSLRLLNYSHNLNNVNMFADLSVFSQVPFPKLESVDLAFGSSNDLTPLRSLSDHVFVELLGSSSVQPDKCPTDQGPFSVRQFCNRLQAQEPLPGPIP